MRELHWHPNADEWQYYISGKARMTVVGTGERARTMDFEAGDVGYIEKTLPHYIENTGDTDCKFLELFRSSPLCRFVVQRMAHPRAAGTGDGAFEHRQGNARRDPKRKLRVHFRELKKPRGEIRGAFMQNLRSRTGLILLPVRRPCVSRPKRRVR
jgi:oxalate decarboxylase/phosphoglucose isomerase-like protein (cupin superfamily)